MQTFSLNKVILIGRLGAQPEGRYTQKGQATSSFSIATHEKWKRADGCWTEHTEWHHIVLWGALAEFSVEALYKGQLIQVEGMLRTRTWEDDKGVSHKTTEILGSQVVPLEHKPKE
jgi:single-strand DNA-binding protein